MEFLAEISLMIQIQVIKPVQKKQGLILDEFSHDQSLLLLDRLNDLDLDHEADFCEKLHEDAERLYRSLSA
ncbi:hypothetical protein L245_07455, partial [Salmonella enterica subsp. enterica serovar Worthington str. BCH-4719]